MYRIAIDYSGLEPIVDHWYGDPGDVVLPEIGHTGVRCYSLLSLDPLRLPVAVVGATSRLYFPHYLASDLIIEDLFFRMGGAQVELLNDLRGARDFGVFKDYVDHMPRRITFTRLAPVEDPASPEFDPEQLTFPHHQLGGGAFFKQPGGHLLECMACGGAMRFVLQFGNDDGVNVDFADDGAVYYWWCARCQVLGARVEGA